MNAVHNVKFSQLIAVTVTVIIELFFAFLGGWTLYDTFEPWGLVPAIMIGGMGGITLFLLCTYVFIFREYAVDAAKVFSMKRGEVAASRIMWAGFLVLACLAMDSFFNADRMVNLPSVSIASKVFMWAGLQIFCLIPFALGKLVHSHVNVVDVQAGRQRQLANRIDESLKSKIEEVLPTLNAADLIALKSGDLRPLQARLSAVESEKKAIAAPATDPLAQALAGLMQGQQSQPQTDSLKTV